MSEEARRRRAGPWSRMRSPSSSDASELKTKPQCWPRGRASAGGRIVGVRGRWRRRERDARFRGDDRQRRIAGLDARAGTSALGSVGYWLSCAILRTAWRRDAEPYCAPSSRGGNPITGAPAANGALVGNDAVAQPGMSMLLKMTR